MLPPVRVVHGYIVMPDKCAPCRHERSMAAVLGARGKGEETFLRKERSWPVPYDPRSISKHVARSQASRLEVAKGVARNWERHKPFGNLPYWQQCCKQQQRHRIVNHMVCDTSVIADLLLWLPLLLLLLALQKLLFAQLPISFSPPKGTVNQLR